MAGSSEKIDIDGGVHCADFVGCDQDISYGFSTQEVGEIIAHMMEFVKT